MESSYVVTFYFRDLGEFLFSLCVKSSESIPSRMEFFYVFLGFGIVGFSAQADKSCLTDSSNAPLQMLFNIRFDVRATYLALSDWSMSSSSSMHKLARVVSVCFSFSEACSRTRSVDERSGQGGIIQIHELIQTNISVS